MIFRLYPEVARPQMHALRELVFTAAERLSIDVEETLKWGEPSYLTAKGSTLRLGWDEAAPVVCQVYFHCQSSLVSTFRELYPDLDYEGNRAIHLPLDRELPREPIIHCMELALSYHTVKRLPLLGANAR